MGTFLVNLITIVEVRKKYIVISHNKQANNINWVRINIKFKLKNTHMSKEGIRE
jgi:hypothetical protein